MTLGYDPEVPAGFQDADIEMAELASQVDNNTDQPCDDPYYMHRWETDDLCMNCGFREKYHLQGGRA